jgi:hypothetical protein
MSMRATLSSSVSARAKFSLLAWSMRGLERSTSATASATGCPAKGTSENL